MDLARFRHSGDLFVPPWLRRFLDTYILGSDTSLVYVNIWSLLHLVSGTLTLIALAAYTDWTIPSMTVAAFGLHALWELWQYVITNTPRTSRGAIDILTDTVAYMFGFTLPLWWST